MDVYLIIGVSLFMMYIFSNFNIKLVIYKFEFLNMYYFYFDGIQEVFWYMEYGYKYIFIQ